MPQLLLRLEAFYIFEISGNSLGDQASEDSSLGECPVATSLAAAGVEKADTDKCSSTKWKTAAGILGGLFSVCLIIILVLVVFKPKVPYMTLP